jgi:hypothetical protein
MEVALYVRVSTTRQPQTQMIEQQMARLREHLTTHPDWHLAEDHIYRDDGYRGAKLNWPGLDRLRGRAAMAGFERILITAPDRLARNKAGDYPLQTGSSIHRSGNSLPKIYRLVSCTSSVTRSFLSCTPSRMLPCSTPLLSIWAGLALKPLHRAALGVCLAKVT